MKGVSSIMPQPRLGVVVPRIDEEDVEEENARRESGIDRYHTHTRRRGRPGSRTTLKQNATPERGEMEAA